MSEKRLAEIRERLEKATPGPWVNEGDVVADEQSIVVGVESYNWRFIAHINSDTDDGPETPPIGPEEAKANAELIANAPVDIAFLLDNLAVAKAETVRSAMQFVAEGAQQAIDGHQGADGYYCGYRDALGHFTDVDTLVRAFNLMKTNSKEDLS